MCPGERCIRPGIECPREDAGQDEPHSTQYQECGPDDTPAGGSNTLLQPAGVGHHERPARGDKWAPFQAYQVDRASTPSVGAANRQLLRRIGIRRIPDEKLRKIRVPVTLISGCNDR